MIFVMIAGSYTPVCLIVLHNRIGYILCALVWSIAILGIILKGLLDYLSQMVVLCTVYRHGLAVCTGISSAVSGSFTAGIWMVAGGRHHLYGRRGDLLLKNADV